MPPITPKQFIKYTRWLDKKGLAVCDGSTMEPMGLWDIFGAFIIIGGVWGSYHFMKWFLLKRPIKDNWGKPKKEGANGKADQHGPA